MGRVELATGALGESFDPHRGERLVRGSQLIAGVDSTICASQTLAEEEPGTREVGRDAGAFQPLDGFDVTLSAAGEN